MSKQREMERLLDVLLVLKEIDLAIVPIVPSERMCQIGAEMGDITPEMAKRVYTIMLLNAQTSSEAQNSVLH